MKVCCQLLAQEIPPGLLESHLGLGLGLWKCQKKKGSPSLRCRSVSSTTISSRRNLIVVIFGMRQSAKKVRNQPSLNSLILVVWWWLK